jgi:hypothetical protein
MDARHRIAVGRTARRRKEKELARTRRLEADREERRAERESGAPARIAPSPGPYWLRRLLAVLGGIYVVLVFYEAVGRQYSALYFCQIAKLFPGATLHVFENKAQGIRCGGQIVDIDVRPFFPIHADDKESRFDRAIYFYSGDAPTMQALDSYIVREYNRSEPDKIGGVVLTQLKTPVPSPGTDFPRFERKPLSDYPEKERHVLYKTPKRILEPRCQKGEP